MNAPAPPSWEEVRAQFLPHPAGHANFASMAIGSMPKRVRDAIRDHRQSLDADPWGHLRKSFRDAEFAACDAVSAYFGVPADGVALTTGTTLGLALLYGGLRLLPGQEILTTPHEFSGALRVLDSRQQRHATPVRRVPLLTTPATVTEGAVMATLAREIRPHTRVLAITWVYSNSGVRLPVPAIAQWLKEINAHRPPAERVLLCVDGVHGFGVEDITFDQLGCAAFVSGCHKWICGPRGTGVWCATAEAWGEVVPFVPTSSSTERLGLGFTPGGVQAYDHIWALKASFEFMMDVQPARIRARVHELADRTKSELKALRRVTVVTPTDSRLSSGIVCFDIAGTTAADAVKALEQKGVVATVSSNDEGRPGIRHVRVSLSMLNTEQETDTLVRTVASL
jgi:isopenicillin-N epimerase